MRAQTNIHWNLGALTLATLVALSAAMLDANQTPTSAQTHENYYAEEGVALAGYDTVAYFTESEALVGNPAYTHEWQGVTWQFSSADHRDLFAASPTDYAPQYGGFCSLNVAEGTRMDPDMTIWEISENKLYFYANPWAMETWATNREENEQAALAVWEQELITHIVDE